LKQCTASCPAHRLMRVDLSEDATMAQVSSLGALASRFIESESLPWIATAPGSKMKVIYHDPHSGMLTILAKLEPGAGIPPHVHDDLEQTFALEASLRDEEGERTARNFGI